MFDELRDIERMEREFRKLDALSVEEPEDEFEGLSGLYVYATDPVGLALDVFGLALWEGQERICAASVEADAVACKSGHKCGKSTVAAVLAWWFACTRADARVIVTAPTDRQVKQVVWREIRRLWRESRKGTCQKCGVRSFDTPRCGKCGGATVPPRWQLPEPALAPDTGITLPENSQILGFTAKNQEAMAGISAPEILYIVDEASGVDESIFEAIEGNLAADARILLISNPTRTAGQFFRAFHQERAEWRLVSMSSEETPNAKTGERIIPGLAGQKWVEKRRRVWGVEDPRYQVRVKGNFPRQAANVVVSMGLLEQALASWLDTKAEGTLKIGVDVARFGDDSSVAFPRKGLKTFTPKAVNGYDTIQVASMVLEMVRQEQCTTCCKVGAAPKCSHCGGVVEPLRAEFEDAEIRVDAGGGYGGGVVDRLREVIENDPDLANFVRVIEVHPASTPDNDTEYERKRDELWFGIRNFLRQGGTIPPGCDELEEELIAVTYKSTLRDRFKVESKEEIKKQLGRSPDYADAFALAVDEQEHVEIPDPDDLGFDDMSRWDEEMGRGFG